LKLSPPRTLADLADYAGRRIRERLADLGSPDIKYEVEVGGDPETLIEAVAPIEALEPGCLTFAADKAYLARAEKSEAAAIILPPKLTSAIKAFLRAPEPRLVFSVILELLMGPPTLVPAAPERVSFKDRSRVEMGEDVIVADGCYIGADVRIGRGCRIYPQVFIDDQVTIGENCILYPKVTIFRHTTLGRNVVIHAGSIIGDDGFGFNQIPDPALGRIHHLKNEHIGGVIIEDFVELGSMVCVDRGLAGMTVVGAGTKTDNQVQIGHNVKIGRDCIIVAQTALAGSARLGDQVFLSGHVGIGPGITVGDGALITAKSMVVDDLPPGRVRWAGRPAQKADREWRQRALARRELPRLREFLRLFKKAASFEELKTEFFKEDINRKSEET